MRGILAALLACAASASAQTFSANVFDTTQYEDSIITSQLAAKAVARIGRDELWIVGGKLDSIAATGVDSNGYDAGLKFVAGTSKDATWLRLTALNDANNPATVSYGGDVFARLGSPLSVFGYGASMDLSTDKARHTDYGAGLNLNLDGRQNLFALFGRKSTHDGARLGYVFSNYRDHLLSAVLDTQEHSKAVYSSFDSWSRVRFLGSWNPNLKYLYTQTYLTFGMGELTSRTLTGQVLDQFVYKASSTLTVPGLADSDNTVRASTPPLYLATTSEPAHAVGQFLKLSWKVTPKDTRHNDFDLYGVTPTRSGVILIEEVTRDAKGQRHYGGGIAWKVWRKSAIPALSFVGQTNSAWSGGIVWTLP